MVKWAGPLTSIAKGLSPLLHSEVLWSPGTEQVAAVSSVGGRLPPLQRSIAGVPASDVLPLRYVFATRSPQAVRRVASAGRRRAARRRQSWHRDLGIGKQRISLDWARRSFFA